MPEANSGARAPRLLPYTHRDRPVVESSRAPGEKQRRKGAEGCGSPEEASRSHVALGMCPCYHCLPHVASKPL